jgi:predicted nuclease of restriction endonuclease-like RecB superfamily
LRERDEDARAAFARAWERARDTGGWKLRDGPGILPVPSRGSALVPDFTFVNGATGEVAHLEILGFWSERHLIERVDLVREAARRGDRILLAASENMKTGPESLAAAAGGPVIPFKGRLDVKGVLAVLEGSD